MARKPDQTMRMPLNGEAFAEANNRSMQAITNSYLAWLRNAGRVQSEMLRFASERLRKDAELSAKLAACRNPSDMLEQQVSFANALLTDYADEGQRMLDLMSEAAAELQADIGEAQQHLQQQ